MLIGVHSLCCKSEHTAGQAQATGLPVAARLLSTATGITSLYCRTCYSTGNCLPVAARLLSTAQELHLFTVEHATLQATGLPATGITSLYCRTCYSTGNWSTGRCQGAVNCYRNYISLL